MHANHNATSFRPGHSRSPESIAKQRATIAAKIQAGTHVAPMLGRKLSPDTLKRRSATQRGNALGSFRIQNGYRQVMTFDGYRYEHRVIAEMMLRRKLLRSEVVHHRNENKQDNDWDNLEVMTKGAHSIHHHTGNIPANKGKSMLNGKWSRQWCACIGCGTTERRHQSAGRCNRCYSQWWRDTH